LKKSNAHRFLHFYALKSYEARRTKNHLHGVKFCTEVLSMLEKRREICFHFYNLKSVTSSLPIRTRSSDPIDPADDYRLNSDNSDPGIEIMIPEMSKSFQAHPRIVEKAVEILGRFSTRHSSSDESKIENFNVSNHLTLNISICALILLQQWLGPKISF